MGSHVKLAFAVASALAFFPFAGTASAAIYTATYTGTVSGSDTGGLFGAAGKDLTGASFTAVFTYDPTLGTRNTYSGTDLAVGGPHTSGINPTPSTSPILSDSFTINGVSISLDPSQYGEAEAEGSPSTSSLLESVRTYTGSTLTGALVVGMQDPTLSMIPDLTKPQSYSSTDNYNVGAFLYGSDYLSLASKTAAITASVPEPGSLALMVGAVGLLAFTRRRRSV